MYRDDTREPGQVADSATDYDAGLDRTDLQGSDVVHDPYDSYTGANNLGVGNVSYFDWSIWDVLRFGKKGVD